MIVYCPVCGDAWEFDTLHEEAEARYGISLSVISASSFWPEYKEVFENILKEFQTDGCKAFVSLGSQCDEEPSTRNLLRAEYAATIYNLLGSDIDGAASMFNDFF